MNPQAPQLVEQVRQFVTARATGAPGEYTMCDGGQVTLYASCFAAMTLHYLGQLEQFSEAERTAWVDYLNGWQQAATGLFIGPELHNGTDVLHSARHDFEHIAWHLTAHILPALAVLGGRPRYPLIFAHPYLDSSTLQHWLDARNWRQAWVEGNNLLFMGQFLTHLLESESYPQAADALARYFDWLDSQHDPATGLWGTADGAATPREALYGGYHQLLVYYYHRRPLNAPRALLDVALGIQHLDGGFTDSRGGGSCEDVDAVDVIVNIYKQTGARPAWVRFALKRALASILRSQTAEGGFVYKPGKPFLHMGITATAAPAGKAELFSTWFRLHTLALIGQVLADHPLAAIPWRFNPVCSMGWHRPGGLPQPQPALLADVLGIASWAGGQCLRRVRRRLIG